MLNVWNEDHPYHTKQARIHQSKLLRKTWAAFTVPVIIHANATGLFKPDKVIGRILLYLGTASVIQGTMQPDISGAIETGSGVSVIRDSSLQVSV